MHAMEFVIGKKIVKQTWLLGQKHNFEKYFDRKPTYDDWKDNCYIAIMTFAQLIRHFGWKPMYKFMLDYEDDIVNHENRLPQCNQDKIDQWVLRYSKIVGYNIKRQFELWGLPVSYSVETILVGLPKWCPTEEIDAEKFFQY
jgi:hypothetical protein